MNRKLIVLFILVLFGMTGCNEKKSEEKKPKDGENRIQLVWQSNLGFDQNATYFNKLLAEKGYPYEVEFVTSETIKKNQVVDIKETGMLSWVESYDTDKDVLEKKLIALDKYLDTDKGKKIKETVPQKIWDSYKINGKNYSILTPGQTPYSRAYIWNTELAKKYNVHPEEWTADIWRYQDELMKITDGEKKAGNDNFYAVSNLLMYCEEFPGLTHALGIVYPITIRETDEKIEAEFLYETSEYQKKLENTRKFYELGLCNQEKMNMGIEPFLMIDTAFRSKESYLAFQEDNFWDTHEVKEISQDTLWELGVPHPEIGITTASKKQDEAFDLLYLLYTDEELVNALAWGEKGVSYEVVNGKAVKPGTQKDYISHLSVGNMLLAYPEVNADKNLNELYPLEMEKNPMSKLSGFHFHGEKVKKELNAVAELNELMFSREEKIVLDDMELTIQKYKEAGIDKIIEEWNRQFSEWSKESR